MKKTNVAVLCGGKSAEHEVSLTSAFHIAQALDPQRYNVQLIAIDKKGFWHKLDSIDMLAKAQSQRRLPPMANANSVTLVSTDQGVKLYDLQKGQYLDPIDVVFPALHGPFGEDGSIQGLLKTLDVAFVGAGVLGSAVSMDKEVMKILLQQADLPIADFIAIRAKHRAQFSYEQVSEKLGSTLFIKAANLGSSIGVHKVRNTEQWQTALDDAFLYDHKVVVEEFVKGREIECSVLGNSEPRTAVPGEIKPTHDFYSYDAKYLDANGAELMIPAHLTPEVTDQVRDLAVRAFEVLQCEGLARVDFFVKDSDEVIINEINTLPGFTPISMYPKMWEAAGLGNRELVDTLIQLATERFERDHRLRTSRD